jgi:cytochrome c-type biogenesis protein
MGHLVEAFVLGNTAILTNVCVLPLYPGMVAYLAADSDGSPSPACGRGGWGVRGRAWLGVLVLAGVLVLMTGVGLALYLLRRSFGTILPILLPLVYGAVIVLGILLLLGRSPFARLRMIGGPVLGNRYAAAFVYGLLLGPMTLPCAGPLLVSAFVVGAGSIVSLADSLLYAFAFGLGFGWPLILLPVLAVPAQRGFTRWLTDRYGLLARASGVLLVAIGLFGAWSELLPQLR